MYVVIYCFWKKKLAMKKTMIIMTLLVSVLTCFAEEVSTNNNIEQDTIQLNYDFGTNYDKLVKYLGVRKKDAENVKNTHKAFCNGMFMASKAKTVGERNALIKNSIDYELNAMRIFLDDEQYRKFLIVFNYSLKNRGFSKISR